MSEWKKEKIAEKKERMKFYIVLILALATIVTLFYGDMKMKAIDDKVKVMDCEQLNHGDSFAFHECLDND